MHSRRRLSSPNGAAPVAPLLQATHTVPIVFVVVADPVGPDLSLAWRGPAATPPVSLSFEYSSSGKWLELLKADCARRDTRCRHSGPRHGARAGQFGAIQAVAPPLGVDVTPINVRDAEGDRARHRCLRAMAERGHDRDRERVGERFIGI